MRKKKGDAKPKRKSKARTIISYVVVVLLAIVTGAFGGLFYVNNFMQHGVDYSKYSEDALRDNESEIYAKYKSANTATLTGVDAFIVAEKKLEEMNIVTMDATGAITAMKIKQDNYTKKYKNNNLYFVENISKGRVIAGVDTNIAERDYYDASTGMVKVYKGTDIQATSATFNKLDKEVSLANWKESNGTTPLNFHPYIVSTQTVTSTTNPTACTLDNGSKGYVIQMSLNSLGAFMYVKQISHSSGVANPNFSYINLQVYLNQDGSFYKINVDEKYTVKKMGISAATTSVMTYAFSYQPKEIPLI